jgi:3-hydroxyisobutyrate dehydrogenase-like beta-hydroxyacid dehydrogenase
MQNNIGMIGYGEVGKVFCAGLALKPGVISVSAWDIKFLEKKEAKTQAQQAHQAHQATIIIANSMQNLCAQADFLISAVTASNTLAVAREAAEYLRPGTLFLDLNSASPGSKQQAARVIEAAGGHYVEAGVMTSVPPYGIKVPMLLGGAKATELAARFVAWGLDATAVSVQIGVASAIKMCRSVMIKGLEALVIESYSTARHYGVEGYVLPTLVETFPSIDWEKQGAYFFSRVVQHGKRRAEEMREAANTVKEAGFAPFMSSAIADKQQWVADQAAAGVFAHLEKDSAWQVYADKLLAARPVK